MSAHWPPPDALRAAALRRPDTGAQAPPPPASPCPCPRSFLPVCGADGNTYSNACLAKCAGAAVAAEGECAAAPAAAKPAAAAPAKPAAAASAAAKPAAAPAPAKAPAKAAAAPPAGDWWRPSKDMAFQYQLINVFDPEAHFIPGVQVRAAAAPHTQHPLPAMSCLGLALAAAAHLSYSR